MPETKILVIDDDSTVSAAVEERLEGTVVDRVLKADLPGEGIRIAVRERPDAILLDINMPQMDGFKVCRHLKKMPATRGIPILFLTIDRNITHLAKALDCGGADYIRKPFHAAELEARVKAALRTKRLLDLLLEQARIDALTGLKNRAAMDDALRAATAAHERTGQPLALLMIDLDNFKAINDTYGHGVGDAVLSKIGGCLVDRCRPYDHACRFGGDEFSVILGNTEGADARLAAERILSGVIEIEVQAAEAAVVVRSSAGLVSSAEMPSNFEPSDMLKAADQALYRAKHQGRGRLVVTDPI